MMITLVQIKLILNRFMAIEVLFTLALFIFVQNPNSSLFRSCHTKTTPGIFYLCTLISFYIEVFLYFALSFWFVTKRDFNKAYLL